MKTPSARLTAALAILSLTATGCPGLLAVLRDSVFQDPSLSFKTASLENVSLAGLTLDTIWELHNPNSAGISLSTVDYALSVEGKKVVSGEPAQGLTIAPVSSSELHFPASIRFADLAQVVQVFLDKDEASYRVEGKIGVETPIGVLMLPLSHDGTFEVPKVPQVSFGNPRVTSVGLQGATVEFPLQVTNRNSYGLPVSGLQGTLSVGGTPVGTLSTGDLGALAGRGSKEVALPLTINLLSAASAVVSAVEGGPADLRFNAQVQSGRGTPLPLSVQQAVQFLK